MSKSRRPPAYGRRPDTNQKTMTHELRQMGYEIDDWSQVGNGVPDKLVRKYGGIWLEIKTPEKYNSANHGLEPAEIKFFSTAPGAKIIACTAEMAQVKIEYIGLRGADYDDSIR